jgi:hypothetical protein
MEASQTGIPATQCPSQKQSASWRTHVAALSIFTFAGFADNQINLATLWVPVAARPPLRLGARHPEAIREEESPAPGCRAVNGRPHSVFGTDHRAPKPFPTNRVRATDSQPAGSSSHHSTRADPTGASAPRTTHATSPRTQNHSFPTSYDPGLVGVKLTTATPAGRRTPKHTYLQAE